MPVTRWIAASLLVGAAIGYGLHGGSLEPIASAQNNAAPPNAAAEPAAETARGRYRISAWSNQYGHGCYMVDSASGDVWTIESGQGPRRLQKAK